MVLAENATSVSSQYPQLEIPRVAGGAGMQEGLQGCCQPQLSQQLG
jgi:hypothetical protein